MLKHGIMGLLNYGEMTGYEIMGTFRDSLNFFWRAQTSQIYRELQILRERGLVEDRLVEQSGKPDKKIFSITHAGREELKRWLREDEAGLQTRSGILMRVFFRGEMGPEENREYFRSLQGKCQEFRQSLEAAEGYTEEYAKALESEYRALYWKMTVDFGHRYMEMVSDWCEECMRKLEEMDEHIGDQREPQGEEE